MEKFEPITEERLASRDNGRVQVQLQSRRDKLIWMVLHAALTVKSKGLASDTRDSCGPFIVARYLEVVRALAMQENFKFILKAAVQDLCPDEEMAQEVVDIFQTERILLP